MEFFVEHFTHLKRIFRMSFLEVREEFRGAKFGVFWEILRTAIFFTIYGAFYILMRGGAKSFSEMISHIMWLFAALLPWQLISSAINQTPRAYKRNRILITTIKFPTSIIPTFDILGKFMIHLIPLTIMMIVFSFAGLVTFGYLWLLYYYFAMFMLLWSLMSFLSIICSVSLDFYKFWQVITRIFIYLNPIFWSIETAKSMLHSNLWIKVLKLNPFVYIFEGFRSVIVHGTSKTATPANSLHYHLYFWGCIIVLFSIGVLFQKKLRKLLPDIL